VSRRDYDEGYEDARKEMQEREFGGSRGGGGSSFTAAVLIKYLAIVIVVIIVAYVILRILNSVTGAL
jgi:predicted metalloprotease